MTLYKQKERLPKNLSQNIELFVELFASKTNTITG